VDETIRAQYRGELEAIEAAGTRKVERVLASPQGAEVLTAGHWVRNFCANNYLGLAADPRLIAAAHAALDTDGYGMASVRFICGTATVHTELETALARFLSAEAAILYSSCFDANGGVFETLLGEGDVVISDQLNHASIIDGIRLCSARRLRYQNRDLDDLRRCLVDAATARRVLVVTDGVFSMDGHLAPLREICDLAEEFGAMVMVDDSHGVGVCGPSGRGTLEHFGVEDRVDLVSGTLGKALGGASGGYLAGRTELIELCRQRSRPYLFSNALAPAIAAASLVALELLESSDAARLQLWRNASRLRQGLTAAGFTVLEGEHPIVPVLLGEAALATAMADALLDEGIYAVAFSYPVVPVGSARIRLQCSAAHADADVDHAVAAFIAARARCAELR